MNSIMPNSETVPTQLHQAQLSEAAVSLTINGLSYAVMMASPKYLKDFALGFALSEGLVNTKKEVTNILVHSHENGWQVDVQVLSRVQHRIKERRRIMAGPSGCGLCGLESIDAALATDLIPLTKPASKCNLPTQAVINKAKEALPYILHEAGGVRGNHCASFFDLSAQVIAFREDVGRHSAFDKLLGHLANAEQDTKQGFALITSRCSHDLVIKAIRMSLSTLVTLAQPTDLAVSSARRLGLTLFCFQHGQLKRFA